jgi:dihydrofolate synthase/folylpolyglutamate synthase
MLNTKDVRGYMVPLASQTTLLHAVEIPGEKNTLPASETRDAALAAGIKAEIAGSVAEALRFIAAKTPNARVLICGSLYLAGTVLRENA